MTIYFASGNAHKKEEIERLFKGHTIRIPSEMGISFDPEETESTFAGNALLKARALFELVGSPVLADDSGICVDALGGAPGVRSARYGSENGQNLDSPARNALLLEAMKGKTDRSCRFVCNMVLLFSNDRYWSIQETLEGVLVDSARGEGGFGYDPLLYVPEYGKTVAEMSASEKDECSHRGKAARLIAAHL